MHTFLVSPDVLKAALLFAAKADVRYYLNGMQFERRQDSRRLVATDGHRLILVNLPDLAHTMNMQHEHEHDEIAPTGPGDTVRYLVPRDVIEKAVKAFAKEAYIVVRCEKESVTVSGITAKLIDGRFPEYERIIPSEVSGEPMQFNAAYLYDCAKARKLLSAGAYFDIVPLAHNGDGAALIHLCPFAIAVLMGVRGKGEVLAGPPEWYSGKQPRTVDAVAADSARRIGREAVRVHEADKAELAKVADANQREAAQDELMT